MSLSDGMPLVWSSESALTTISLGRRRVVVTGHLSGSITAPIRAPGLHTIRAILGLMLELLGRLRVLGVLKILRMLVFVG
eukprot:scaffold1409_cov245-Pinguiococcus_pyrenoidosus.AAC.7